MGRRLGWPHGGTLQLALQLMTAGNVRYPVLYVLHGYGQDPRDLEAVAIFTNNDDGHRTAADLLSKGVRVAAVEFAGVSGLNVSET